MEIFAGCGVGTELTSADSTMCRLCPMNSYNDHFNSTCSPCPNGTVTSGVGGSNVSLCVISSTTLSEQFVDQSTASSAEMSPSGLGTSVVQAETAGLSDTTTLSSEQFVDQSTASSAEMSPSGLGTSVVQAETTGLSDTTTLEFVTIGMESSETSVELDSAGTESPAISVVGKILIIYILY